MALFMGGVGNTEGEMWEGRCTTAKGERERVLVALWFFRGLGGRRAIEGWCCGDDERGDDDEDDDMGTHSEREEGLLQNSHSSRVPRQRRRVSCLARDLLPMSTMHQGVTTNALVCLSTMAS